MGVRVVSYVTGRTWVECVREWGPEEYIWFYEGGSKSRLNKRLHNEKLQDFTLC